MVGWDGVLGEIAVPILLCVERSTITCVLLVEVVEDRPELRFKTEVRSNGDVTVGSIPCIDPWGILADPLEAVPERAANIVAEMDVTQYSLNADAFQSNLQIVNKLRLHGKCRARSEIATSHRDWISYIVSRKVENGHERLPLSYEMAYAALVQNRKISRVQVCFEKVPVHFSWCSLVVGYNDLILSDAEQTIDSITIIRAGTLPRKTQDTSDQRQLLLSFY